MAKPKYALALHRAAPAIVKAALLDELVHRSGKRRLRTISRKSCQAAIWPFGRLISLHLFRRAALGMRRLSRDGACRFESGPRHHLRAARDGEPYSPRDSVAPDNPSMRPLRRFAMPPLAPRACHSQWSYLATLRWSRLCSSVTTSSTSRRSQQSQRLLAFVDTARAVSRVLAPV